jgi:hypothetical protein
VLTVGVEVAFIIGSRIVSAASGLVPLHLPHFGAYRKEPLKEQKRVEKETKVS